MTDPTRLIKSASSDAVRGLKNVFAYFYWNTKGVRITPDCRVHLKAKIAPSCSFFGWTRIYDRAHIGHYTYGTSCIIDNARVGKFCSVAPGAILGVNRHPLDLISTHPMTYDAKRYNDDLEPAVIGNDVWVGAYAVVLAGVHIPDGCVIAASAVVTKSPEPFTIIGGIPARPIGKRHGDSSFVDAISKTDDIKELKRLAVEVREAGCSSVYTNL